MDVKKFLEGVAKEIGTTIEIVKFARFEKGEGIEKRQEDLSEEVAKQVAAMKKD